VEERLNKGFDVEVSDTTMLNKDQSFVP
jgi:hypothetical protein